MVDIEALETWAADMAEHNRKSLVPGVTTFLRDIDGITVRLGASSASGEFSAVRNALTNAYLRAAADAHHHRAWAQDFHRKLAIANQNYRTADEAAAKAWARLTAPGEPA